MTASTGTTPRKRASARFASSCNGWWISLGLILSVAAHAQRDPCLECVAYAAPECADPAAIMARPLCTQVACAPYSECWPSCRRAGVCDRTPVATDVVRRTPQPEGTP